jgi:hypothetical protein
MIANCPPMTPRGSVAASASFPLFAPLRLCVRLLTLIELIGLSLSMTFPLAAASAEKPPLALIPLPANLRVNDGHFTLSRGIQIIHGQGLAETAKLAADQLAIQEAIEQGAARDAAVNMALDSTLAAEAYKLDITPRRITISGGSPAGVFYGIQTLRQLVGPALAASSARVPCLSIQDQPRFAWRGLMLDCSRTFQSLDYLKKTIDRLSFYKMNVLHLHLTDDQGWRIEIKKHPELTQKGARFSPKYHEAESHQGLYTQADLKDLVQYAALRGVTIVPEIEMPGHSHEVLVCHPELSCTGKTSDEIFPFFKGPGITQDVLCAGNEDTFWLLQDVLDEVVEVFPSKFIHIGGDEAPKLRWKECPKCQARIKAEGLKSEHELQSYFIRRIEKHVNAKGRRLIGWSEILQGGLAPNAAVMDWIGGAGPATKAGHDVVMSPTSHCYFDYPYGAISSQRAFGFDPTAKLSPEQARHVLGLQANFWSHIDREPELVDKQLFPRLLAIAERGWSPAGAGDWPEFKARLDAQLPQLRRMGVHYRTEHVGKLTETAVPASAEEPSEVAAARGVLQRFIGDRSREFLLELMPVGNGLPAFEVGARDGVVTVRGSDGVALCRGAYEYLRQSCGCMKTWSGEHVSLPVRFPDAETRKVAGPYRYRLQDNICTFGYTTAFFGWPEWERYLDVMALHGYNLHMAPVGGEAIWLRVWKQFGVSDASARQWLTGPAFLPWQRMGNVYGHDGPVPASYFAKSVELQKRILMRMRSLGIHPIAPAFSGFVPHGFKQAVPDAQTIKMNGWCGFVGPQAAEILHPLSPYYAKIGGAFIHEWQREFGPAEFFQADSFNEMRAPVSADRAARLKELAGFGEAVYSAIKAGNPQGTWVMMAWLFLDHGFWDKESAAALLSRVPNDKMLVLDLFCETSPQGTRLDAFFGKQWVLSTIPNFGGNSQIGGDLGFYAKKVPVAPAQPKAGNLVGFGYSPEGTENNEVVYEMASDAAWSRTPIDVDRWLESYCRARYGTCPAKVREAWKLLGASIYAKARGSVVHRFQKRPEGYSYGEQWHSSDSVGRAAELLLQAAPEMWHNPLFLNDFLEVTTQEIGARVDRHLTAGIELLNMDETELAGNYMSESCDALWYVDDLLGAHSLHRLDRWVNLARRWGDTPAERDYYEQDAKRQITVWGGPMLSEYAARYWSGLIGDYYVPRWQGWYKAKLGGKPFDMAKWEERWIRKPGNFLAPTASDPIAVARNLIEMTRGWNNSPLPPPVGQWRSGEPKETYGVREWDVTAEVKAAGAYRALFRYATGSHRLDIQWAALVADGVEQSRDAHEGTTGIKNQGNRYLLRLADYKPGAKYILRASIKSAGGRDSNGAVYFKAMPAK